MAKQKLTAEERSRRRRMQWWREARFGMFIHWGLFSAIGRHGRAVSTECMPFEEWEPLSDQIKPKGNPARQWAKLARQTGQKYMVLTTKAHEGFCLFHSELTDYCATKRAAGRDLVADFVEAARAEGMRVGFYYSLMDWRHPDGARSRHDEGARRRFVDYIHGQVRELCTNYGPVDVLWYDVSQPLDAEGWESAKMNRMVRQLQPDTIINNRSQLPEDFDTPEQKVEAAADAAAQMPGAPARGPRASLSRLCLTRRRSGARIAVGSLPGWPTCPRTRASAGPPRGAFGDPDRGRL